MTQHQEQLDPAETSALTEQLEHAARDANEALMPYCPFEFGKSGQAKAGEAGEFIKIGIDSFGQDTTLHSINEGSGEGVVAVFDGIGSKKDAASEGSRTAAEVVSETLDYKLGKTPTNIEDAEAEMRSVFSSLSAVDKPLETTAIIGRLWRDKQGAMNVTVGSIGDSLALLVDRKSQDVVPLNNAHDRTEIILEYVQQDLADTALDADEVQDVANAAREVFTQAQDENDFTQRASELLADYPQLVDTLPIDEYQDFANSRNVITGSVSELQQGTAEARINTYTVEEGQVLLLVSDGISDPLNNAEISRIVNETTDPNEACTKLVEAAGSKSGARAKNDDKSVIFLEINAEDPEVQAVVKEMYERMDAIGFSGPMISETSDASSEPKLEDIVSAPGTGEDVENSPESIYDIHLTAEELLRLADQTFDYDHATEDERKMHQSAVMLAVEFKQVLVLHETIERGRQDIDRIHAQLGFDNAGLSPAAYIGERIGDEAHQIQREISPLLDALYDKNTTLQYRLDAIFDLRRRFGEAEAKGSRLARALSDSRDKASDFVATATEKQAEISEFIDERNTKLFDALATSRFEHPQDAQAFADFFLEQGGTLGELAAGVSQNHALANAGAHDVIATLDEMSEVARRKVLRLSQINDYNYLLPEVAARNSDSLLRAVNEDVFNRADQVEPGSLIRAINEVRDAAEAIHAQASVSRSFAYDIL